MTRHLSIYYDGKPCRRCGRTQKYRSGKQCVHCQLLGNKKPEIGSYRSQKLKPPAMAPGVTLAMLMARR
jgi:ribosomal protein L37E